MRNPLRSIDRWASQSGDRAAMMLWIVMITMAALAVLTILGFFWYTAPGVPTMH